MTYRKTFAIAAMMMIAAMYVVRRVGIRGCEWFTYKDFVTVSFVLILANLIWWVYEGRKG